MIPHDRLLNSSVPPRSGETSVHYRDPNKPDNCSIVSPALYPWNLDPQLINYDIYGKTIKFGLYMSVE